MLAPHGLDGAENVEYGEDALTVESWVEKTDGEPRHDEVVEDIVDIAE